MRFQQLRLALAALGAALLSLPLAAQTAPITVDYPAPQTLFPPDLAPPTFLFRDGASGNTAWRIDITFASGAPPIQLAARTDWMKVGDIDYRCIADTNELPRLTPQQSATRTWTPDAATWDAIRRNSVTAPATITFSGFQGMNPEQVRSQGSVVIRTSADPVGAPIFYRDVPLMPAELKKGVIKPLPKAAIPLIAWRLKYVDEPSSRVIVENLPTCANCHSFSTDGKTLGMDLDGPQNDKGLYALVPIRNQVTIRNQDVIAWSSFKGKLGGPLRVGFMSQVSPDSRYVVTMVNASDVEASAPSGSPALPKDVKGNFYVSNFKDYRFLQVFYPTRGVLAWYSRETGKLQPLPGADDPRFVHTNATWSPDGKYLVFARAAARDPYPNGSVLAEAANDPNETQIQYDLYRIPFNDGRGGTPEPIAGASSNGMSNSFPKVSPDGRWIVYVQAKNGLLMRPDSQLYIVPFAGGKARRLSANTPLMNSWHSFSPNGRWLVFSSKSRSPYTKMFLTHIDEQGNDSPAVLVENTNAANRAVNIPEFVNIAKDAWLGIDAPATEFYRLSDNALDMMNAGQYDDSIAEWRRALAMQPDDVAALSNLGAVLSAAGRNDEAMALFTRALTLEPDNYKALANLGVALARMGKSEEGLAKLERARALKPDETQTLSALGGVLLNLGRLEDAETHLRAVLDITPGDANAQNNLGGVLSRQGRFADAIPLFEKALASDPQSVAVLYNLGRALAGAGKLDQGISRLEQAVSLPGGQEPVILDRLSEMYAQAQRFPSAASTARRALELARQRNDKALADALAARIATYENR